MMEGFTPYSLFRELILPPACLFALFAIGFALRRGWPKAGRALMVSTLALSFVLCTGVGARLLVRPLENLTAPLIYNPGQPAQAIVVLSAGRLARAPEYGGADIPDYIALARLRYGAHLQHQTGLPLLVSGGDPFSRRADSAYADAMAAALREDFGTPVRWIERRSTTTAENALYSAAMLQTDGVRRILLVTDAMHMPRARRAFARTGLDVVEAPTMFFGFGALGVHDFVPTVEGLRRSYYALYEWIGLAWYRIRFGA
ncbi:MAG: YdcF family protein [Casimicrobiaceae bacterium]